MASTLSQKWLTIFCQKAQNFVYFGPYDLVQISPACSPNTDQIMYRETLAFQYQHQYPATITNADNVILLFDTYYILHIKFIICKLGLHIS